MSLLIKSVLSSFYRKPSARGSNKSEPGIFMSFKNFINHLKKKKMKEIKKISLSNVINKLSRNEMRYVMAGSGDSGGTTCAKNTCSGTCSVNWNGTCACNGWGSEPATGTCTATYNP